MRTLPEDRRIRTALESFERWSPWWVGRKPGAALWETGQGVAPLRPWPRPTARCARRRSMCGRAPRRASNPGASGSRGRHRRDRPSLPPRCARCDDPGGGRCRRPRRFSRTRTVKRGDRGVPSESRLRSRTLPNWRRATDGCRGRQGWRCSVGDAADRSREDRPSEALVSRFPALRNHGARRLTRNTDSRTSTHRWMCTTLRISHCVFLDARVPPTSSIPYHGNRA